MSFVSSFNENQYVPSSLDQKELQYCLQNLEKTRKTINISSICLEKTTIEECRQIAQKSLLDCKECIKRIKEERHIQKFQNEINKLKKIKNRFLRLKESLIEKIELLSNREQLYESCHFETLPNFCAEIEAICKLHPSISEGCAHLKSVLSSHMRLKDSASLTHNDLRRLEEFQLIIRSISLDIEKLVSAEIQWLSSSFQKKERLLEQLSKFSSIPNRKETPFPLWTIQDWTIQDWTIQEKIELYVRAQQILYNPFEAPTDAVELLDTMSTNNTSTDLKNLCRIIKAELIQTGSENSHQFWGSLPVLERKAHELASKQEDLEFLCDCKIKGLKLILNMVEKQQNQSAVVIIGAGPSGLLHAILAEMKGFPYIIIEKRTHEKSSRDNVITLGKNNPKDLEFLCFLGAVSCWKRDQKASFAHMKPNLIEVRIGDVENALTVVLSSLHEGISPVMSNRAVSSIQKEDGAAVVIIADANDSQSNVQKVKPSAIFGCDGFSGNTRRLLGIARNIHAKTTQIAFSILHKLQMPQSLAKRLFYILANGLKGIALAIRIFVHKLFFSCTLEEAYAATITGGPSAIFRIPQHDYLIRCLRKEEQKVIDVFRKELLRLKKKALKTPLSEKALRKQEDLQRRLDNYLSNRARKVHPMLDVMSSLVGIDHHVQPMAVSRNFVVDISVGRSESSFVCIGKTASFLRGDASHVTDPYSGYGCKITLEETFADMYGFDSGFEQMSRQQKMCLHWGQSEYQKQAINQGLKERALYQPGSELLSRYTDIAADVGIISQDEAIFLLQNHLKTRKLGLYSDVKALQIKLANALQEAMNKRENGELFIDCSCNSSERHFLLDIISQILQNPSKTLSFDETRFDRIVSKMVFHDVKEGAILALLKSLQPKIN